MSYCNRSFRVLVALSALTSSLVFADRVYAVPVTIYVAATGGSDNRNRTTASSSLTPVATISRASSIALSGDTIEVAPGTYTSSVFIGSKSNLTFTGKANAAKPILKSTSAEDFALVLIAGSDHITFTGFEVDATGTGPNINGFAITPRTVNSTITLSHDITVSNCKIHNAGGSGISTIGDANGDNGCDFITVSGNEIYNCLTTGKYRGSAISLFQDKDTTHTAGYHSLVENNIVHDNVNHNVDIDPKTGQVDLFKHTDGNGIIIDTTGVNGPKILIQNNVIYRNGGRGINVYASSNVTALNNTLYGNKLDPYLTGGAELAISTASNVYFSNNVAQGNGLAPIFSVGQDSGTTNGPISIKNTTYTGTFVYPTDSTQKTRTQKAVDANSTINSLAAWGNLFVDPANGDFHLRVLATRPNLTSLQSQTVLNCGSSLTGDFSDTDINGIIRKPSVGNPPGGAVDRGAYEQSGQISITYGGYRYQRSNGHYFQSLTLTAIGGNADGPISVVVDNLTGASLVNPTGTTVSAIPAGSPYVNTGGVMAGTVGTAVLEFTGYPTTDTIRTLVGAAPR